MHFLSNISIYVQPYSQNYTPNFYTFYKYNASDICIRSDMNLQTNKIIFYHMKRICDFADMRSQIFFTFARVLRLNYMDELCNELEAKNISFGRIIKVNLASEQITWYLIWWIVKYFGNGMFIREDTCFQLNVPFSFYQKYIKKFSPMLISASLVFWNTFITQFPYTRLANERKRMPMYKGVSPSFRSG